MKAQFRLPLLTARTGEFHLFAVRGSIDPEEELLQQARLLSGHESPSPLQVSFG
jgi:hypothetical protein